MEKSVKAFETKRNLVSLNAAPQYIQDINCRWFWQSPFFSTFLSRFKYEESDKVPTIGVMAQKGTITLVIGTDSKYKEGGWFQSLPYKHQEAVLVHEILHLVHETHFNSRGLCLEKQIFNVAADICINDEIEHSSINGKTMELPRPGCFLEMVQKEGYKDKTITELIYNYMMDNKDKFNIQEAGDGQPGDGNGQPGGGSGNGQSGDGSGNGQGDADGRDEDGKKIMKPFDSHQGLDEADGMDEVSKAVVQGMTHVAKMRGYGSVAGRLQDFVEQITTSRINWKQILRKFMKSTTTGTQFKKHHWGKANRRSLPLPGKKKFDSEIVVAIDTSGSISNDELKMFFSEIDKMAKFSRIRLVCCDTELYDLGEYKKGGWKKIQIAGRGGTELSPIFNFMQADEKLRKTRVVILTDGEFSYHFNTFGIRALWALTYEQSDIKKAFSTHDFLVLEKN